MASKFDLSTLFFNALLPFFRVSSFVMAMPVMSGQMVPVKIKVILSLCLTLIVLSTVPEQEWVPGTTSWLSLIAITGYQIIIGALLGLVVHVIFQSFVLAGQIIGTQMGLGFAQLVDPQSGVSVPTLGQFYVILATLLYLAMNGHLFVIEALINSFDFIPSNQADYQAFAFTEIFSIGAMVFSYGFKISLPVIIALLITNIAFGVMSKAAPQFNLFSIGFSISMIVGFALVWVTLFFIQPVFNDIADSTHSLLYRVLE